MDTIFQDGIWFKGQYANALKLLLEGREININSFKNGGWEPTVKLKRFIELVSYTKLTRNIEGDSLRQTTIKLK